MSFDDLPKSKKRTPKNKYAAALERMEDKENIINEIESNTEEYTKDLEVDKILTNSTRKKGSAKTYYFDDEILKKIKKVASTKKISESAVVNGLLRHILFKE
jgi:hypothetical protein